MTERPAPGEAPATTFSPIDGEPQLRWWRRLRIVPAREFGAGRRAVLVALFAWLPIALWALATGRLARAEGAEPLLQHYGVHVRFLLAIGLFILAEPALHRACVTLSRRFVASGAVTPELLPRFEAVNRSMRRLADASLPWVLAVGVAVAWSLADPPARGDDALSWAVGADGGIGFGGLWAAYVARPIFLALLAGWLWRIGLVALWLWRIDRLGLALVPSHPDRTGGIGFVEKLPGAFALVTFALAAVLASRWAHEAVHHGTPLVSFRMAAIAFAATWTLLLLLPLLAFARSLRRAKRAAGAAYADLVGRQGRLVHRRWIERKAVDDEEQLEPTGIGAVADAAVLYEAVTRMRSVPVGKSALLGALAPIAIPFLLLALLRIPLKDLFLKVVHILV